MADPIPALSDQLTPDGFTKYVLPDGRNMFLSKQLPQDQINQAIGSMLDQSAQIEEPPQPVQTPQPSMFQKAVTPLTQGLGHVLGKVGKMAAFTGGMPFPGELEQSGQAGQELAKHVIPQDLTTAGAMAGTALAGPAGMAARPLLAGGIRMAGGTLGGASGSMAEGKDALPGAVQGALGGFGGELVGQVGGMITRALPGAKGAINRQDTRHLIRWMEDAMPSLRGKAGDAQSLQAMAKGGEGRQAVSDYFGKKMDEVERAIGGRTLDVPTLDPSKRLTVDEVTEKLADLGYRGFGGAKADPNTRNIVGKEARDLWKQAINEVQAELGRMPNGTKALEAFLDGRSEYSKGQTFLKMLRTGGMFNGYPNRVDINTTKLQGYASDKRSALENRFDPDEFTSFLQSLRLTRTTLGQKDRLAPGPGGAFDALRDVYGRGIGGAPQILGSLIRTGLPNVGSQYVGRQPFQPGPGVQTLIDMAGQQAAQSAIPEEPRFLPVPE